METNQEKEWFFPFWGPLVCKMKIDKPFINKLLKEGKVVRDSNNLANRYLAGEIDNQFYFDNNFEEWFTPYFQPYLKTYESRLFDFVDEPAQYWKIKIPFEVRGTQLWINYQHKMEHQPLHSHDADLSFVIYLQVPIEITLEHNDRLGERSNTGPGKINFYYGDMGSLKFAITQYAEMPVVGDIYIFPSWLRHYVNSFKSDVERISVSGNLHLARGDGLKPF
jgi:hypothetical protein